MGDATIVVIGIIGVVIAIIFAGLADAMDVGGELVTGSIAFLGAVSLLAVLIFGHIGSPSDGDGGHGHRAHDRIRTKEIA